MKDHPNLPSTSDTHAPGFAQRTSEVEVDADWFNLSAIAEEPGDTKRVIVGQTQMVPRTGAGPMAITEPFPVVPGYEILALLGRGGMGQVYMARQLSLNRVVALKTIRGGPDAHPDDHARFGIEAEAVAALQHPNIVQIYEVGQHAGLAYIAFEYLEGGTLAGKSLGQPQDPTTAALTIATLAAAVDVAHLHGIIHRDLKPSNVLFDREGRPKITDFGLAKRLTDDSHHTLTGQVMGTPDYMPPEQASGQREKLGPATDIYSLGAILYELLTGRPPFQGVTVQQTVIHLLTTDPLPPRRVVPTIPRDLDTICLKCLQKDPAARYSSARDLADDLSRFLQGRPIHARPTGWPRQIQRWLRRRPREAVLVALVVVLVAAVLAGGVFQAINRHQRQARLRDRVMEAIAQAEQQLRLASDTNQFDAVQWKNAELAVEYAEKLSHEDEDPDLVDLNAKVCHLRRAIDAGKTKATQAHVRAARDQHAEAMLLSIRLEGTKQKGNTFDRHGSLPAFSALFRIFGLEPGNHDSELEFVRNLETSRLKDEMFAALREWTMLMWQPGQDQRKAQALEDLANRLDTDPWRKQLFQSIRQQDWPVVMSLMAKWNAAAKPAFISHLVGHRLVEQGYIEVGLEILRDGHRRHPSDFWLTHEMAQQLQNADPPRMEEAAEYLRAAMALRPDLPGIWTNLASLYHDLGRLDEAIYWHQRVIERNPDQPHGYYNLGQSLRKKGHLDAALVQYRKVLELGAGSRAEAWMAIAEIHAEAGRLADAESAYKSAISLDPHFADGHVAWGKLLTDRRNYQAGAQAFRQALSVRPDHAGALVGLGNSLYFLGNPAEALPHLIDAVRLHARAAFYFSLGRCLARLGNHDEAFEALTLAVEKKPDFVAAFQILSEIHVQVKDLGNAELMLRIAVRQASGSAIAHFYLGSFLMDRERYEEASFCFNRSAELNPGFAEAWCNQGLSMMRLARFTDALASLRRGHEIGSKRGHWPYPSAKWIDEAEQSLLMEKILQDRLSGKPLKDGIDIVRFALFCSQTRKLFALAAQDLLPTYESAMRSPDHLEKTPLELAVRVFIQAGAGHGDDGFRLDPVQRREFRIRALRGFERLLRDWEHVAGAKPQVRPDLVAALRSLRTHSDLAPVRDSKFLAALAAEERAGWQAIWLQLDQSLERLAAPPWP